MQFFDYCMKMIQMSTECHRLSFNEGKLTKNSLLVYAYKIVIIGFFPGHVTTCKVSAATCKAPAKNMKGKRSEEDLTLLMIITA